ncbi:MAG: Delta(1)-pyrroline-2-carboxylate reductase [Syntrophomonadaceae bacterium]|nr:Delta(1)-pyrroline-2-carboxylate reductase [Bacillota bacterium]
MKRNMSPDDNSLRIISGSDIGELLVGKEEKIIKLVRSAYIAHQKGRSALPHSVFLRVPLKPQNRIIGLPAYIDKTAGIKWIASFPNNIKKGLDRASAVIILNSLSTGRPYIVLEGSIISTKRTAASAALATTILVKDKRDIKDIALIGCGFINFEIFKFIVSQFPYLKSAHIFDLNRKRAFLFSNKVKSVSDVKINISNTIEECIQSSKIISFATTASTPHITNKSILPKDSIVLHISLRDIGPDIIKNSVNIVDDLEHVNRENTSIHLASKKYGNTNFITASLGELLLGKKKLPAQSRPIIFSPFGLGILDTRLARFLYEQATEKDAGILIKDFIPPNWHERPY